MINTKLDIGGNLLKLRQAKKHTQATLAKAIGINQPNYCDMEAGRIMPTIPTLQKLADFLEVPLVKLLENEDEKTIITSTQNNTDTVGSVGNLNCVNNTNNFFESKEIEEKLQNALKEAFASMVSAVVATEMAKYSKPSV